ncbi:hypothetical protein [Gimesia algae]|uniref:Uncharacterized protein n=1 Tax=Gimesia algae TaxID=2527971 RepID=A0A517VDX4_9PLAN|nr:hypothetical protein [Gimesia algae]QDT91205.1 hypothetical protein Pan161_28600 [Gimesia algae]
MRSKSNDFFSTLLVLIPLVAVPMLAIFGIPEIAPVKKSALNENELFENEDSTRSPFEEISFDASSHEIDLGHESSLADRSGKADSGMRNPFGEAASTQNGHKQGEEWLPPAGALEGWQLDSAPAQREPDQKMTGLTSPDLEQRQPQGGNPIRQASFENQPDATSSQNPFNQGGVQQLNTVTNPFDQNTPTPSQAEVPQRKVIDQQFRQRAETMLRRDSATWSAAVQKLNELGIRDYSLKPGIRPDEFLFSCTYSPPHNPRVSYRFEAEALDPLKAVIKVLQQVDEWNQSH